MKPIRLFLITTLGIVATIRAAMPLTPTVVLGHSMEPTLRPLSLCVVNRNYYQAHPLRRGDVIVLRWRGETYIKRVHALPGDRLLLVRYFEGGRDEIIDPVNAVRIRRAQAEGVMPDLRVSTLKVPPGYCYVLGDNEIVSEDSRDFGPILIEEIIGRAEW